MNLNGTSLFVMPGASPAPQAAVVVIAHATAKKFAVRVLSHLLIWVGREQRVR
jgi:hypothetical protein